MEEENKEETKQENEEVKESENTKEENKSNPFIFAGIAVVLITAVAVIFNISKTTGSLYTTPPNPPVQGAESNNETSILDNNTESITNIKIEGGSYYFNPNEIKVKVGEKVKITFENTGGMHDFVIDEFSVRTEVIKTGESEVVEFTAGKAGSFEFYCSVGNHRQMGMKGALIVE